MSAVELLFSTSVVKLVVVFIALHPSVGVPSVIASYSFLLESPSALFSSPLSSPLLSPLLLLL